MNDEVREAERELAAVKTLDEAELFRVKWLGLSGRLRALAKGSASMWPEYRRVAREFDLHVQKVRTG